MANDPSTSQADRAVRFIQNLTLVGDYSGQPLILRPWQESIVRQIFGTIRPDGRRQYRRAFIFLPRGNAKTTLLAAIGLYCLIGEGKTGQQIVSAAADHKQAALIFDTARQMIQQDPDLFKLVESGVIEIVASQKRIVFVPANNTYAALSSVPDTKHGGNISVLLFDELHAQPNRQLWDVLTTCQGKRREPLTITITTAGVYNPEHIAWQEWDYARRVKSGLVTNPAYLPILYGAEPEDDWTDPEVWYRCNPALGDFLELEFLENECQIAKELPSRENAFKQLYLNVWTQQAIRWLPMDRWQQCGGQVDPDALEGLPCVAGMDLAPVRDLTALSLVFEIDGKFKVLPFVWCSEGDIALRSKRDNVDYAVWQRQGWLRTFAGDSTDYVQLKVDVLEIAKRYKVTKIAIDMNNAAQFGQTLQDEGLDIVWHRQGFPDMSPPCKFLEKLLIDGNIEHGHHPILTWCAGNAAIERKSTEDLIRPAKNKSTERIDALVATIMALSLAMHQEPAWRSIYEDDGKVIWV